MLKHKHWPTIRIALCGLLLSLPLGCAEQQTAAGPPSAPVAAPVPQTSAYPVDAGNVLLQMANYLANTPRFSVNIQDNFDVVQESGQKIEFSETRKILVSRPDRLRVEIEQSDGERHVVQYDGNTMTVSNPTHNVYAQAAIPGGIDAAVTYFVKDLKMRLPLAVLLVSRLASELEQRTLELAYVEKTVIHGVPAHHLAGITDTVDYQVWVADGNRPLPLRVVLTYKDAEGQPQFRAQFSDWNLTPEVQDVQFAFSKPAGAQKIAFLAEQPQIVPQGPANPELSGAQP